MLGEQATPVISDEPPPELMWIFVLLARQRRDRQRHRRGRHVEDRVDLVVVVPVAGDVDADVGLVLVIGGDHLHGLARDFGTVIGDRHLHGGERALAGRVRIEARHVREHADLDDVVGNLRLGGA
ncbi:hypothetical protein ACVWZV_003692 [Bradyrhizobium sp. GM5.1]